MVVRKLNILLQIWDISFVSEIKESIEYKILTLKLRVHFAILPIRIVHLHQTESDRSPKVTTILNNVSDKFSSVDDEKVYFLLTYISRGYYFYTTYL